MRRSAAGVRPRADGPMPANACSCGAMVAGVRRANRSWLALLLTIAGLAATACGARTAAPAGARGGTTSAQAATAARIPVSVELSWLPSANQMPFYLALGRGYYRQAGLEVKLVSGKGSGLAVQQVGAGKFDLGQADLSVMALARAKGAPVESFMVESERNTFGLLVAKSAGIKTWKDLYGHRVLVSAGSPETFLLPATFKRLGLDLARVRVIDTSPQGKVSQYIQGQAAATGGGLTGVIPVVGAKRASNALWFGDVLNIPDLGVFARRTYIERHPAVVRAFTAATLTALRDLVQQPAAPAAAYQAIARLNPGPLPLTRQQFLASWAIFQRFIRSPDLRGRPLGWESRRAWGNMLQILHADAGLEGSLNPSGYETDAYLPKAAS